MKGYIERFVAKRIEESLQSRAVTVIVGSRQVGKSTLLSIFMQKAEEASDKESKKDLVMAKTVFSYVLDDLQLRSFLKKDPRYIQKDIELSLGTTLERVKMPVYIFIDEVQKGPAIFEWIKQIHDANSQYVKFVVTGSSAAGLMSGASETLAGRVDYITVYPIIYPELLKAKTDTHLDFLSHIIDKLDSTKGKPQKETDTDFILSQLEEGATPSFNWENYIDFVKDEVKYFYNKLRDNAREASAAAVETMFYGGLPRVLTSPISERVRMIKNYIEVYLEKEVGILTKSVDLELFGLSLQSFAQQNGETLNINQVSKDVNVSRPSLYKYLELLENTYLIKRIYPYATDGDTTDSTKSVKLYYLDTGMVNNLSYVTSIPEMFRPDVFYKVLASWIICTLLVRFTPLDQVPVISYWQDYAGHKIDLVFERGEVVFGFIMNKSKDNRRTNVTYDKFAEATKKKYIVLFEPVFDHTKTSLEYDFEEYDANGKPVLLVRLPVQLLG